MQITFDYLKDQKEKVLRLRQLFLQYHKFAQVHAFLEKQEPDILKFAYLFFSFISKISHSSNHSRFVESFSQIPEPEEKLKSVTSFLKNLNASFPSDPLFSGSSEEELKETLTLVEKTFMCRIYTWFPFACKWQRYSLFHLSFLE